MLVATSVGIVMVPFFFVLIYKIKKGIRMDKVSRYRPNMDKLKNIRPKKILPFILIMAFSLAFSSCKLGKEYARPDLNLPETIDGVTTDTASVSDIPWQSLYQDTVLQNLISQALENNKDMKIAAAKIKEMMAAKRINFSRLFPSLGATLHGDTEVTNYGGSDNRSADPQFDAKLNLRWELDLWGNIRWANEADIAAYMQSIEAQRALKLTIIAGVAAGYYELCALDEELSIVRQTLDARREGVRLAKLRYEGGLTSETAYNQALVELARTETLIPDLERQIQIKESDLSLLLGDYSHPIRRGRILSEQHLPDALPAGLPSSLVERRPDIRQAEMALKEANAQVGVAYTDLFPKISLTGIFGLESNELGNFLKSPYWNPIADLTQPLFAMGRNKARLKVARAQYEQAVYGYEKTVIEAFKEVNDAIVSVRKAKEVRQSQAKLEVAARKYLELAQLQYINGVTNYMDVLDAQREFLSAQIGLNSAVCNELLSIVYLYRALGGGY